MTQQEIDYVLWCIKIDMHRFYTWSKWLAVREDVLRADKYECQDCKAHGKYTRATTVHHINFVKRYPELALEKYYAAGEQEERNLVSLCHDCHEARHGYRKKHYTKPLTEERW